VVPLGLRPEVFRRHGPHGQWVVRGKDPRLPSSVYLPWRFRNEIPEKSFSRK
jgi:hypothetical protein